MCGINGIIQYKSQYSKECLGTFISIMNNKIVHRGPDEEGTFIDENIGLGMRRLSIIDLNTGSQPIFNEDRSLIIVLNGEIYNYKTLKQDLVTKGHQFTTASDTEVVLHGFEEYGKQCFNRLKGMFAVAIYDLKHKKVILARDRTGEKPLYYYHDRNQLLFASELKSILATKLIEKAIDRKALNQYLQLTYIPAPLSIFQGILKLLPGHYMEVDSNGEIKVEQYWDVQFRDDTLIHDYEECKEKLRKTLFEVVEECMVSDVPIGTFLSGGIDSTIITGIASKISKKPIDSFTIGFHEKHFDESDRAKLAAELHLTNHHMSYLDYADAQGELDKIIGNMDEPFADSSAIPTYMVSKFARQHVKTVLTGDAGDELFGGYSKYLIGYYSDRYNKIPEWFRKHIIKKTAYMLSENTPLIRKVRKVIDNAESPIYEQRKNLMCLGFKAHEMSLLLQQGYRVGSSLELIDDYYKSKASNCDELSHALYTDFKVVLEGDMLVKVDRASMLNSLETRVPLLHKDMVELAARIPGRYKINAKNQKIILKDTFKDLIPQNLLNATKSGFGVPIGRWFQNELKEDLLNVLNQELIVKQGLFDYDYIKRILGEHFSSNRNRSSELWALYVFQKWYKNNMESAYNANKYS